jgi:cytochrome P450
LGSAFALLRDPLAFLREAHRQYGNVFEVRAGHVRFVVLAGIEANQFVAKEGRELLRSWDFWKDTLTEMECPHSFIAVDGEPHRYQRMLMMPMFAKSAFAGRLSELAGTMRDTLEARFHQKTFVSSLFRHVVSQQIGGSLQGYKPTTKEVEALMHYQSAAMNACSLKKRPRWTLQLPRYRAAKALVWDLADRILHSAQREPGQATYLHSLLARGRAERPEWFTPGDVRNHAIITFLAGIDTMGATLSFMLLELLKQPELRRRLQQEVDAAWEHGLPDLEALEKMDVLQRFIKEVLRLYPTAFAVRRTAVRDFAFHGYDIPKGQDILLFTTSKHTDARYFDDPLRFDIDRFVPPRSEPSTADAFAPFGKGPHSCIGAGLAGILLALNMGLLLHHADVAPACNLKRVKMAFHDPTAALSRSFAVRITPRERRASR